MQPETVGRVLLQGRLLEDSRKQAANVGSHGTLVPQEPQKQEGGRLLQKLAEEGVQRDKEKAEF